MAQSRVFRFTDPDSYLTTIRASDAAILTLDRGEFRAGLAQVTFDRLWMQWGFDSLPRIARSTVAPDRAIAMFLADPQPSATVGGTEMANDNLIVHGRGVTDIVRTRAGHRWASMSLSHADLAAAGEAIAGREVTCPTDTRPVKPSPALLSGLRALHARTIELATTAPGILATPAMAKSLEQGIMRAMVLSLAGALPAERRWLPGQHARIVNRFLGFLEAVPYEPVYLAEICSAIGASERTLRTCCQEILGVGPLRYLWLRRMHLARRALLHADASTATVTGIATAHGFWELGRFSIEYRGLFGESPSVTLRQASSSV